ncbi:MAG: hypothetical protein GY752_01270 [bacterium]|nr:hypothetical protein [bacterium]MCP4800605.1 hypothetical protein [bacterium]
MRGTQIFARTSLVLFLLAMIAGMGLFPDTADAAPRAVFGDLFSSDG